MPQYNEITEMPGYGEAEADYRIAIREAGEDPTLQAQANASWAEKRLSLESQRNRENDAHRSLEAAREALKAQYGDDVPESVYAAKATPEEMKEAAKVFHDTMEARLSAAGHQSPDGGQPSGQPPTGIETTPPAPTGEANERRLEELRDKLLNRVATQAEAQEFERLKVSLEITPAHIEAQRVAGSAGGRR